MSLVSSTPDFKGVFTALITPFLDEPGLTPAIDYKSLEDLIEFQLTHKAHGLVICGTTAESATLTGEEREVLLKFCIEKINKRCPVIVGAGTNSTLSTIEYSKQAKDLGADGLMLVSPYYNKPTQEGLEAHFLAVAEAVDLPIVLYDIPGRAVVEINLETLKKLAVHPNIQALKLATGSTEKVKELKEFVESENPSGGFSIMSGDDHLFYDFLELGADGLISASANVLIKEFVEIYTSFKEDKDSSKQLSKKLEPLLSAFFKETNPSPIKEALVHLKQIPGARVRLPLVGVKEETRELVVREIEGVGFVK